MPTTRDPASAEVEREPMCGVAYCPAPTDPDWHQCLVDGSIGIEHHHVEGRGKKRTLDPTKVVPLSVAVHKRISLNEWGDGILTLHDGSKLYRIWDLHNETIHESKPWWMQPRPESSAVEIQQNSERPVGSFGGDSTAEPPVLVESAAEEAVAGEEPAVVAGPSSSALPAGAGVKDTAGVSSATLAPAGPFNLTDWCQRGMHLLWAGIRLKSATDDWRFQVGDWANEGEVLGEEVHQYYEPFRAVNPESVRVYAWVAGRCEPVTRVTPELSWTHHRIAASLDTPQERQEALVEAQAEGYTTRAMSEAVHGAPATREQHECPGCGALHTVKA